LYFVLSYLLTLAVLVWQWTKEYAILQRVLMYTKVPLRNLRVTYGAIVLSYLLRASTSLTEVIKKGSLESLHTKSCENGDVKWAVMVFFYYLVGEITPLCLVFLMHVQKYRSASATPAQALLATWGAEETLA
jgi:hypothetical protein